MEVPDAIYTPPVAFASVSVYVWTRACGPGTPTRTYLVVHVSAQAAVGVDAEGGRGRQGRRGELPVT
jgi:hypothetical protein